MQNGGNFEMRRPGGLWMRTHVRISVRIGGRIDANMQLRTRELNCLRKKPPCGGFFSYQAVRSMNTFPAFCLTINASLSPNRPHASRFSLA